MKPRLKITRDGRLLVLKTGTNPWAEENARKFVVEHYGSLSAFASRYRFSYSAVCMAFRSSWYAKRKAGQVAAVRQVMGLPSNPSHRALAVAENLRSKRA